MNEHTFCRHMEAAERRERGLAMRDLRTCALTAVGRHKTFDVTRHFRDGSWRHLDIYHACCAYDARTRAMRDLAGNGG